VKTEVMLIVQEAAALAGLGGWRAWRNCDPTSA
jgi:hypothetical protein